MEKLHKMGFTGNLPTFISNLLKNRTFRVKVGSEFSDLFLQENGVPQGSVISPTLFIILINDILKNVSHRIKYAIYADDIVIWSVNKDPVKAKEDIQEVLNMLGEWQDLWGTTFSPTKTNYILF